MFDYGSQLKNFGSQLQNYGMQIQSLVLQMPMLIQNIAIQLQNMASNISNIGNQIFLLGVNLSNNSNMGFQMNNNIFGEMPGMNIMNQFPNNMLNQNNSFNGKNSIKNELINIFFQNSYGQATTITTSRERSVEELVNLYIQKVGLNSDYSLKKLKFLYNRTTINPKEKTNLLNYGFHNGDKILVIDQFNLLGGP